MPAFCCFPCAYYSTYGEKCLVPQWLFELVSRHFLKSNRSGQSMDCPDLSLSKKACFCLGKNRGIAVFYGYVSPKSGKYRVVPTPYRQLFQIHGSKFQPDPSCDGGQASVVCITHGVFFFCIRKDSFNRFFAFGIDVFATICLSDLFCQIQILLPDVSGEYLLPFFIGSAFRFARTMQAIFRCASVSSLSVTVGCCMS